MCEVLLLAINQAIEKSLMSSSVPLINFPSQTLVQPQACVSCGSTFLEASLEAVTCTGDASVDLVSVLCLKESSRSSSRTFCCKEECRKGH